MDVVSYGKVVEAEGLVKAAKTQLKAGHYTVEQLLVNVDGEDFREDYIDKMHVDLVEKLEKVDELLRRAVDRIGVVLDKYRGEVLAIQQRQAKEALEKLAPAVAAVDNSKGVKLNG